MGLWALIAAAAAQDCELPASVSPTLQVAWISPLQRQASSGSWLEVVAVSELQAWLAKDELGEGPTRLLQRLGMVSSAGSGPATQRSYKITIFDVEAAWLCRPVDETPGEDVGGVLVCDDAQQRPARGARRGYGGCGYSLDSFDWERGFDVFRIRWMDAASRGFCVMPLERFIEGS